MCIHRTLLVLIIPLMAEAENRILSVSPVQRSRAERFDPSYRLSRQAKKWVEEERYDRALQIYGKLKQTDPENTQYHRGYQNCLIALDKEDRAIRIYRHRLRARPDKAQNWYLLGRMLDSSEKRRYFEKAIETDPQYPWGYYGLAVYWGEEEHYRRAVRLLRKAFDLGLDEPFAYSMAPKGSITP